MTVLGEMDYDTQIGGNTHSPPAQYGLRSSSTSTEGIPIAVRGTAATSAQLSLAATTSRIGSPKAFSTATDARNTRACLSGFGAVVTHSPMCSLSV